MKNWIFYISLFMVLLVVAGCSSESESETTSDSQTEAISEPEESSGLVLELAEANVTIVNDKSLVGAIGITEGERKGEELVPTALYYEFVIENTGDDTLGVPDFDKGIKLHIEPKEKLKSASEETIGFNIYNPEGYEESGVGYGQTSSLVLDPGQEMECTLYYDLGVSEENSQVPLLVPSDEELNKLSGHAFHAFLVVTIDNKEITRFNLDEF